MLSAIEISMKNTTLVIGALVMVLFSGCGRTNFHKVSGPTTTSANDDGTPSPPATQEQTLKMVFSNSAYAEGMQDQINSLKAEDKMTVKFQAVNLGNYTFNPAYVGKISILVNRQKVCELRFNEAYQYVPSCSTAIQLQKGDQVTVSGNQNLRGEGLPAGQAIALMVTYQKN